MGSIILYVALAVIIALTLVAIGFFVVVPVSAIVTDSSKTRNRRLRAMDEHYKSLAEQATHLQQVTNDSLERLTSEVSELNKRVAAMDKLLREVE